MKRLLSTILTILIVCVSFAQTPVLKSSDKVNINGEIYYIHKVLPQQTLYSICKAYEVESQQLLSANPTLSDGLKAGMILYIPSGEKPIAATQTTEEFEQEEEEETSADDIEVKTDEQLHTVKWFENISIIAKKYDVSADDIVAYNKLSSKVLKIGQVIIIPKVSAVQVGEAEVVERKQEQEAAEEVVVEVDPYNADAQIKVISTLPHFSEANPLKVSLVLNLNAKSETPSSNYYDLYSGALMAIEELKESGLSINLKVVDISDPNLIQSVTNDIAVRTSDIVIGPAEVGRLTDIANSCKNNNIPFVSLMDPKAESFANGNPCFFHLPVNASRQVFNNIDGISVSEGEKVTLVFNSDNSEAKYVNRIKSLLTEKGIAFKELKYNLLEGRTIFESVTNQFSNSSINTVVIASEVEAFASDAIRNIWLLDIAGYQMKTYVNAKVRNFDTIEEEILYTVNAHMSTSYFVDYGSDQTRDFILKYRALFNAEPSNYAFHGYDTFKFFLTAFKDLGREHFMDYVPYYRMNLIQTDISFERVGESGGYVNVDTRDVEYLEDESIVTK